MIQKVNTANEKIAMENKMKREELKSYIKGIIKEASIDGVPDELTEKAYEQGYNEIIKLAGAIGAGIARGSDSIRKELIKVIKKVRPQMREASKYDLLYPVTAGDKLVDLNTYLQSDNLKKIFKGLRNVKAQRSEAARVINESRQAWRNPLPKHESYINWLKQFTTINQTAKRNALGNYKSLAGDLKKFRNHESKLTFPANELNYFKRFNV